MNMPAPSLGLIRPRDIQLRVESGKEWSQRQKAKAARAAEPNLFGGPAIKNELQPMPYQIKVRYACQEPSCGGHDQTIIDWEVGSAAYWWNRRYPANEIPERLKEKWESMMSSDKDTHFYIGNQHQYRQSFSILGTWYPGL